MTWKLAKGRSARNLCLKRTKESALRRGIKWLLSDEDFDRLVVMHCHYCGVEPNRVTGRPYYCNGEFVSNGLDRVDNSKPYEATNVVPCCTACNYAKRFMTLEQFVDWGYRLHENLCLRYPRD